MNCQSPRDLRICLTICLWLACYGSQSTVSASTPDTAFETVVHRTFDADSGAEAGMVTQIVAAQNQSVAANQTLVQLSSEEAQLGLQQAVEELRRSQALIERAKAVIAQAKNSAQVSP
ncbi:MAG: hypothetical protein R3C53_03230 [Pirellulaceae bacterium]